jgi:hypothetical protein
LRRVCGTVGSHRVRSDEKQRRHIVCVRKGRKPAHQPAPSAAAGQHDHSSRGTRMSMPAAGQGAVAETQLSVPNELMLPLRTFTYNLCMTCCCCCCICVAVGNPQALGAKPLTFVRQVSHARRRGGGSCRHSLTAPCRAHRFAHHPHYLKPACPPCCRSVELSARSCTLQLHPCLCAHAVLCAGINLWHCTADPACLPYDPIASMLFPADAVTHSDTTSPLL